MSRKDYRETAAFMHGIWQHINQDNDEQVNTFYESMSKLGDEFLDNNTRFNRDKFEQACMRGVS